MKEVILNGFLGDKYGKYWTIQANTISDVFSCIEANYPLFRVDIIEMINSGADVDIQCGNRLIDEEDLLFSIPEDSIVITPVPAGAKSGGAKILAAIALVVAFVYLGPQVGLAMTKTVGEGAAAATVLTTTGQIVVATSASLAMAGLSQMMAPDVEAEGPGENNYLFNGPQNTVAQNNVVPVLMGEMIVGGVIIASGTVSGLQNRESTFIVSIPGTPSTGGSGGAGGGGGSTFNPTFPDGIPTTDIDTVPGGRDLFERLEG